MAALSRASMYPPGYEFFLLTSWRKSRMKGTKKYTIYNNPVHFVVLLRKKGIKQFINMITYQSIPFTNRPQPLSATLRQQQQLRKEWEATSVRWPLAYRSTFLLRSRGYCIHQYQTSSVRLSFHSILNHRLYSSSSSCSPLSLHRKVYWILCGIGARSKWKKIPHFHIVKLLP